MEPEYNRASRAEGSSATVLKEPPLPPASTTILATRDTEVEPLSLLLPVVDVCFDFTPLAVESLLPHAPFEGGVFPASLPLAAAAAPEEEEEEVGGGGDTFFFFSRGGLSLSLSLSEPLELVVAASPETSALRLRWREENLSAAVLLSLRVGTGHDMVYTITRFMRGINFFKCRLLS